MQMLCSRHQHRRALHPRRARCRSGSTRARCGAWAACGRRCRGMGGDRRCSSRWPRWGCRPRQLHRRIPRAARHLSRQPDWRPCSRPIGLIIATVYALWLVQRAFHGRDRHGWQLADLRAREWRWPRPSIVAIRLARALSTAGGRRRRRRSMTASARPSSQPRGERAMTAGRRRPARARCRCWCCAATVVVVMIVIAFRRSHRRHGRGLTLAGLAAAVPALLLAAGVAPPRRHALLVDRRLRAASTSGLILAATVAVTLLSFGLSRAAGTSAASESTCCCCWPRSAAIVLVASRPLRLVLSRARAAERLALRA